MLRTSSKLPEADSLAGEVDLDVLDPSELHFDFAKTYKDVAVDTLRWVYQTGCLRVTAVEVIRLFGGKVLS